MSKKSKGKKGTAKPLKQAKKYIAPQDTGPPFAMLRRGELVGSNDHALAENAASILFAKGIIGQHQHRAAHLFFALHGKVWGRPNAGVGRYDALVAGELRSLAVDGDERDERLKHAYEAAMHALSLSGAFARDITMTVAVYGHLPATVLVPGFCRTQLLKGLDALAGHFIGRAEAA